MVTGMLTPGLHSEFTFPLSLKQSILSHIPDYIIEPSGVIADRHRTLLRSFVEPLRKHEQITHYLMKQGEWDFLMMVFSVLDRAQHDYWADMDPSHPRHNPATARESFASSSVRPMNVLDQAIGRLIEALPQLTYES